jgi:hypothetical protein
MTDSKYDSAMDRHLADAELESFVDEDRNSGVEESGTLAHRLLDGIQRGELTAPPRLVRLLEAIVRVAEQGGDGSAGTDPMGSSGQSRMA